MTARTLIDCGNGVRLERAVPLRLSDGTTLLADHYYPPSSTHQDGGPTLAKLGCDPTDFRPEPNPTLLMRQPYGRDIASTVVYAHPVFFARHGFNVVIQDVRGRGGSEGTFYPFRYEARDGAETIAALRRRPESNGRFGMYGFSYQGITQWLAAAEQPDGLECIAPAQTAHDLFRGWFYRGGALRLASTLGWGLQMLKEDARRLGLHEASAALERAWTSLPAQYLETPYARHPILRAQSLPPYVNDWLEHDQPDAPGSASFWSGMDLSERMHRIRVPALHLAGWYDTYLAGSVDGFLAACREAAPAARDQQYLVAGPWQHIPWGRRIGAHDCGPAANLDTDTLHLRWFSHWLKGTSDFAQEPRIRHFALNENQWHGASTLPFVLLSEPVTYSGLHPERSNAAAQAKDPDEPSPTQTAQPNRPRHLTLHLHSQSQANSSKGDGSLTPEPPTHEEPRDLFVYDPEVSVPAPGGLTNAPGPLNQALLEQGNHLLVYTSELVTEPIHVFGSPIAALHATTSAPFADLTAKLILLKASGEALFLTLGILRNPPLTPDQPYLWQIPLDPTSCVFLPGDCIRLEIAASAYPLFDRNPSTAIPPRLASPWNWARSTHQILHTPDHPSALHLPLAEAER